MREALFSRQIISPTSKVVPLTGGRTNHLWRADTVNGPIVIKSYTKPGNNPLFPNSPDDEERVLRHLHGTALAPDLLDFLHLPHGPVLVYSHIDGSTWHDETSKAARAFEQLHDAPLLPSLPRAPDGSAELTKQTLAILKACKHAKAHTIADLRPTSQVPASGVDCLLHGDPVPGNLITNTDRIVFIDWQCPMRGDPVNDLAIFLSPAMQLIYRGAVLTKAQEESFLKSFTDANLIQRHHALTPWYHWRMAAYCLWRYENGAEEYHAAMTLELAALQD
ncbi:aminoglycoside phosphotransferase family protein [Rhodobacteraceae bacterium D3-12]|nr:aminoglycoside phosphotransferase family protein [Rhodobacteraceae bacterium D3-12]